MSSSVRHMLNSIIKADALQVATNARKYLNGDVVQFDKLLSISLYDRIPNLTHVYGVEKIHAVVSALLKGFCDSYNVIRPMNSDQIIQCAYDLVLTSQDDQLSIEDYVIFFKGAKEGKYGKVLDRLDQQTIFEMLEQYRQQRYSEYLNIKDEQHTQFKGLGPTDRTSEDRQAAEDAFRSELNKHFKSQVQRPGNPETPNQ